MTPYNNPTDARHLLRQLARDLGIDPGTGPSLEDAVRDLAPAEMPTLESMTTASGEHPQIAPVGVAPRGRQRSSEGSADAADRLSRAKADFVLEAERRARR
jgi:hypothetical protein